MTRRFPSDQLFAFSSHPRIASGPSAGKSGGCRRLYEPFGGGGNRAFEVPITGRSPGEGGRGFGNCSPRISTPYLGPVCSLGAWPLLAKAKRGGHQEFVNLLKITCGSYTGRLRQFCRRTHHERGIRTTATGLSSRLDVTSPGGASPLRIDCGWLPDNGGL